MFPKLIWPNGSINNSATLISSFEFVDALDQCYCLKITCHGTQDADLPSAFDPVTFNFKNQKISGLVLNITSHGDKQKRRWDYVLEIRPRLYLLALQRNIKLYPNQSTNAIILDLLSRTRSALGAQKLAFNNLNTDALLTTPFKRLEISYAAHDLDYLQTLIQYVARFYFEETEDDEQVIFIDAPFKLPRHEAAFSFAPDKKEDLHQDLPIIYKIIQKKSASPLQGAARFYDPENVKPSLAHMMQATETPNEKISENLGSIQLYQESCYSPPALTPTMNQRLNQLIHAKTHHYELYSYYSGLRAGQQINIDGLEGFIEQVKLTGTFAHEAWHFDSVATMRSLQDSSWLGQIKPRLPLPATLTGAEIEADEQVNDLGEFKVKFPERLITDAKNDPWVNLRDLQNTSTAKGGASHSMSTHAEVLIASENGQAYNWMILGSLNNNERRNLVKSDNYHESRMSTTGGVNIHLRRQDTSNPYSEINMSMVDNQNNPAGLNLGTKLSTMQDNTNQHGIQEISSGYARRSIMGNYYDTVGDPENPVHQISLNQDATSGLTSFNQQTNVSQGGQYLKSYYTEAIGAQNISKNSASKNAEMSDEFKLFVATIYGEAVGQGPIAWQAVASTIVNRVNNPNFKYSPKGHKVLCKNITEAIEHGRYNDYQNKTPQFESALNFLENKITTKPENISNIIQAIYPIYKGKVTTNAVLYFSPKLEQTRYHKNEPTDWDFNELNEVFIPGINSKDFRFFKYKGKL